MARAWLELRQKRYAPSGAGTTPLFNLSRGQVLLGMFARVDVALVGGTTLTVGVTGGTVDGAFTNAGAHAGSTGRKAGDGAYFSGGSGYIEDSAADTIDAIQTDAPSTDPVILYEALILNTGLR